MKIRSILAELEVVDCRAATEFALNQEVVCITAVDLAARASEARVTPLGMRELVLCRPGDFGGPWTPPGTVSLVLYHAAIPDDAVHASTSCIVAATSLPISKAFERFDRIPQQVVAIDAMKGRLFDTFQHTHNIRQFVQRAYNVLGLPTIVVNTDGRILAHVGEFSDAREDIAAQLKTGYIAPEVQAVIDRDCIVENARAKHYPDASHDISNDENWVTSVVYYKRLELGRFDVYKPQGAFTGYDLELIDYAGSLAGIIIDRMTDVATSSNQGASVLSDILDGRFTQTKDATGRLADAGVDTSGAYAMLTVEGERLFASPTYSSHVGRLMKDVFPHGIWVTHRNTFCMLLPMPHIDGPAFPYYEKLEELTLDNPPLAALLVNNSLRAYVSEPFENILLCPVGRPSTTTPSSRCTGTIACAPWPSPSPTQAIAERACYAISVSSPRSTTTVPRVPSTSQPSRRFWSIPATRPRRRTSCTSTATRSSTVCARPAKCSPYRSIPARTCSAHVSPLRSRSPCPIFSIEGWSNG